jgi:alcohol dehydrogenase (cytochrome c)
MSGANASPARSASAIARSLQTGRSHQGMIKRALLLTVLMVGTLQAQVSFDRLLNSSKEPHNWLTYSGNLAGHRYSQLRQITPANVKNLELQWVFQTRAPAEANEKFEATPLVVDGVMYTVMAPNHVVALDAVTGRMFWMYSPQISQQARVCCGRVNRGLAILGDTLFMGTIDGHMIALDAKTGKPVWDVAVSKPELGYSFTMAPLIIKDKVIMGPAGGEYGIRGFVAAFDAKTGKEAWRFNTVPGPGEPGHETWPSNSNAWEHGGGSIWVTGSFDPELNLMYFGTGNPGPDWNGDPRPGDNLYTDSVIALDPDTGKLKWHYQFTPHDEFDYDATQVPVLVDMDWQGKPRKLMLWANRNGYWYVLDRVTGQFLQGKPFVKVNWADGFDAKGRPNRVLNPTAEGTLVYPNNQGATNWYSPSFSPRTGLFYIPSWVDTYSTYFKGPVEYREGAQYVGRFPTMAFPALRTGPGGVNQRLPEEGYGAIQAHDPKTGEMKWQFKMLDVTDSGVLTTASDLLFAGGREGYFFALDAKTGEPLWRASVGGQVSAAPMSYSVNGRQYVAIAAGSALFVYALRP